MPIPCVDLAVTDARGRVLLLRRRNEPGRGNWWFPGGRVHMREPRRRAVHRILRQECGLSPRAVKELGTYDIIFRSVFPDASAHAITTLYRVGVSSERFRLDAQSEEGRWATIPEWIPLVRNAFVRLGLRAAAKGSAPGA